MVSRNDIVWAQLPSPVGRHLACVLTRDAAIPLMTGVVCALITSRMRGIRSEVAVGPEHGVDRSSVINCDNLFTISTRVLDHEPVGHLDVLTAAALDEALRDSLDIVDRLDPSQEFANRQARGSIGWCERSGCWVTN